MKRIIAKICLVTALFLIGISFAQADAKRSIIKITGDLYRFQNNFHYSVFLVTSGGIIVTDPINADAARWLKAELAKRFNKPIKYLIYSHDHVDHVAGGEVFADTATIVAHANAKADIIAEQRPTAVPDITFSDQMTIELGGKHVELSYFGRSHSDNLIVMRFPAERALYVVDLIPVGTVAWKNMTDAYIPDWMDTIARVEALDFDILVPGHGKLGTKADATAFRGYMDALYAAVLEGAREGKSLEAMQQSIRLEKYKDWHNYDTHLPLNIEGMYNQIKLHRRGN